MRGMIFPKLGKLRYRTVLRNSLLYGRHGDRRGRVLMLQAATLAEP